MNMKHVQIILLKKAVKPKTVTQDNKLLNKNEIYLNINYIVK
jgi:hypothetical protein